MSLLTYSFSTSVVPVPASPSGGPDGTINLTVMGTNPSSDPASNPVDITSIAISIPFGTAASDLTPQPTSAPTQLTDWTVSTDVDHKNGLVVFTFTPTNSPFSVTDTALAFSFYNLTVNEQPGSVDLSVVENGSTTNNTDLIVTKVPSDLETVTLYSNPSPPIVNYDYSGLTLSWSGPSSATYQLQFYTEQGGLVNTPVDPVGTYPGSGDPAIVLTEDTTFYLQVTDNHVNPPTSVQAELTATVIPLPPQILTFSADLTLNADQQGWTVTLKWETLNAGTVSIVGVADNLPFVSDGYVIQVTPQTIASNYTLQVVQGSYTPSATVNLQYGQISTIQPAIDRFDVGFTGAMAVTSDAATMAVSANTGVLILQRSSFSYATVQSTLPLGLDYPEATVVDLAFAANDTLLFVLSSSYQPQILLSVYDTTTWKLVTSQYITQFADGASSDCGGMAVAADGTWVVVTPGPLLQAGPNYPQGSGVYVFSFAPDTATLTTVASGYVPDGAESDPGLNQLWVAGVTSDGQNLLLQFPLTETEATPLYEFSVSSDSSAPLTEISEAPNPFEQDGLACIRTYPSSAVCILGDSNGPSFALCDAASLEPIVNLGSLGTQLLESNNQAGTLPAVSANPVIIYAAITSDTIGVFGPLNYSQWSPSAETVDEVLVISAP